MRYPYEDAFARAKTAESRWPRGGADSRLEPEAWPVIAPRFRLAPGETVFSIGSCFARNVEAYLAQLGFKVPTTEFTVPPEEYPRGEGNGILNKYTPPSVRDELAWAAPLHGREASEAELSAPLLDMGDGQAIDLNLAGFRPVSQARALERRQAIAALYAQAFSADVVVITLGLIEAWWDDERKAHIQETPSREMAARYPGRWQFEMLDFTTSLTMMRESLALLRSTGRPGKRILLTTSPVPLGRSFSGQDAMIANTYAKSLLRTVCGQLYGEFEDVDYFPSYESVVLSRSPEVWKEDLIHVRGEFVGKVVSRVVKSYVESDEQLVRGMQHSIEERMEGFKAAERDIELREGRPAEGTRLRTLKPWAFVVNLGRGRGSVDFGPLALAGCRVFKCRFVGAEPGSSPMQVTLEIRAEGASEVVFSSSTRVESDGPWKVSLPELPPSCAVTLGFASAQSDSRARISVRHAKFIGPSRNAE